MTSADFSAAPRSPRETLTFVAEAARAVHALTQLADPGLTPLAEGFLAGVRAWQGGKLREPAYAAVRDEIQQHERRTIEDVGPELWAEWHRRTLAPVADDRAERRWLRDFAARLPRHCECRRHTNAWLAAYFARPDRFERYFEDVVEFHNAVNLRKGKAVLTAGEARARWATAEA